MKVTLRYSSHIKSEFDYLAKHNSNLMSTAKKKSLNNNQISSPTNLIYKQSHATYLASLSCWTSPNKSTTQIISLVTTKNSHLLKNQTYTLDLSSNLTLKTPLTSHKQTSLSQYSNSPVTWLFCFAAQNLCNDSKCIQLTSIESLIIKTLTRSDTRICSKQELILGINKDVNSYSGLEMGLSRLQNKFRRAFGERLFRSVRNRGYCLVQDVQAID